MIKVYGYSDDNVVVEDAGFILILTSETSTDRYYIVAESEE